MNLLGIKTPLFSGHKLTYNCNLKCKMCPFWTRTSQNLSLNEEKAILKQIYDAGICGVAFEGGEPLLRQELPQILAYSRSLPLHTSLITNGTLLKSRIDEIAPHINGVIYVSIDGLEKTHDSIRGVSGCFKKAVEGINAAKKRVPVTINTTIMSENIDEIEDLVKLAKELGVRISLSVAFEYHNANGSLPKSGQTVKVAKKLVEMRKKGYPLVNSTNYFRVVANEKNWKCKPWALINVGTDGKLILPCYVHNQYNPAESDYGYSIKAAIGAFDWKKTSNCVKCNLHCYVEPSLVLSWDLRTYVDWAFRAKH
ncbi:MAG: PTO1314 family radical SAM protein [Candidatus Bathyarchaeia archaeon]